MTWCIMLMTLLHPFSKDNRGLHELLKLARTYFRAISEWRGELSERLIPPLGVDKGLAGSQIVLLNGIVSN